MSQGKFLMASGVSREEGPAQTPPCLQPGAWKPLFPRTCGQGEETRARIRNTPLVLRWVGFAAPSHREPPPPPAPRSLARLQRAGLFLQGPQGPVGATWQAREMNSYRDSYKGLPWTRARPGAGGGE